MHAKHDNSAASTTLNSGNLTLLHVIIKILTLAFHLSNIDIHPFMLNWSASHTHSKLHRPLPLLLSCCYGPQRVSKTTYNIVLLLSTIDTKILVGTKILVDTQILVGIKILIDTQILVDRKKIYSTQNSGLHNNSI